MIGVFDVRSFVFNVLSVLSVAKKKSSSTSCSRTTVVLVHMFNRKPCDFIGAAKVENA